MYEKSKKHNIKNMMYEKNIWTKFYKISITRIKYVCVIKTQTQLLSIQKTCLILFLTKRFVNNKQYNEVQQ